MGKHDEEMPAEFEKLFAWRRGDVGLDVSNCIQSQSNTEILNMTSSIAIELVTLMKASSKEFETLEELRFDGVVRRGI
jgi:hypothetical protein